MESSLLSLRKSFVGLLKQSRVSPADSQQPGAEQQHVTVLVSARDAARLSQMKLVPRQLGSKQHNHRLCAPEGGGSAASGTSSSSSPGVVPAWATFGNRKALNVSVHGSFGGGMMCRCPILIRRAGGRRTMRIWRRCRLPAACWLWVSCSDRRRFAAGGRHKHVIEGQLVHDA